MKISEILRRAWGYWLSCNRGLLGIVLIALILSLPFVTFGMTALLLHTIVQTRSMLDWRKDTEGNFGLMLESLPMTRRDRKKILILNVAFNWIGIFSGCGLLITIRKPEMLGIVLVTGVLYWLLYSFIVLRWEKEKQVLNTWRTGVLFLALVGMAIMAAQEIADQNLLWTEVLLALMIIAAYFGLTRLELISKQKADTESENTFFWFPESIRGVLDLAEIELQDNRTSMTQLGRGVMLAATFCSLVLLSGSYVYLIFFITDFVVSWQLTKKFQSGMYAVNLIPISRLTRLGCQLLVQSLTLAGLWGVNLISLGIHRILPTSSAGLPLTLSAVLISICATICFVAYSLTWGSGYRQNSRSASYFTGCLIVFVCSAGASAGKIPLLRTGLFWGCLLLVSFVLIARWLRKQARQGGF